MVVVTENKSSNQAVNPRTLLQKGVLWGMLATGICVAGNLLGLLAYQRYMGGDFPFHDEWSFVTWLQRLPHVGMLQYLFSSKGGYFAPVELTIWYLFYAWLHLNIMLIRYTGAILSGATALLTCVMLYRKAHQKNLLMWAVLIVAPFIVCSLNFWDTYSISIESLIKPLMFGVVLLTCWSAERMLASGYQPVWAVLCVVGSLVASGLYAPGLILLPAIVASCLLLRRRINWTLVILIMIGAALLAVYLIAGHAMQPHPHHPGSPPALTFGDLWASLYSLAGLFGNALLSPFGVSVNIYTQLLGLMIICVQITCFIYVIRLPERQRMRFVIPLTLTLYNALVFVEILGTRFNYSGFEYFPRYAILMLGGPVSLLFWIVMIPLPRWHLKVAAVGVLAVMLVAVIVADRHEYYAMPYRRAGFAVIRQLFVAPQRPQVLLRLNELHTTPGWQTFSYAKLQYLEANHLALYRHSGPGHVTR